LINGSAIDHAREASPKKLTTKTSGFHTYATSEVTACHAEPIQSSSNRPEPVHSASSGAEPSEGAQGKLGEDDSGKRQPGISLESAGETKSDSWLCPESHMKRQRSL